jgi:hypothetical protein
VLQTNVTERGESDTAAKTAEVKKHLVLISGWKLPGGSHGAFLSPNRAKLPTYVCGSWLYKFTKNTNSVSISPAGLQVCSLDTNFTLK